MTNQTTESFNPFQMAADGFKSAMETGLKFQQEAFSMMAEAPVGGATARDLRCRMETFAVESTELARRNAEQIQKLFDEGCRSGMEFLQKCFETADANGDTTMMQRTENFWRNTFDTLRTGADAAARANTEMIKNCGDFVNSMTEARDLGDSTS